MMSNYTVAVPFAGVIYLTVEAESEDEAKEQAYMNAAPVMDMRLVPVKGVDLIDYGIDLIDYDWRTYETFGEGNVNHIETPTRISAELSD